MRTRVILGVCAMWLLVALVQTSQAVLAGSLQGTSVEPAAALRDALIQNLPWILPTLAIIALAVRFPVTRASWRRHLPIHLIAFPVLTWTQNIQLVAGYGLVGMRPAGLSGLMLSAAKWTLLRIHVAALVYLTIAAATQAWVFYRQSRARELDLARMEGQLARARLDALTAQIRPHFLFNTLHTIGQLWRSGRADDADAMLDHLGALFQHVQQTTSRPLVSLDEELETVEAYLAIEAARFRDRLCVEIDASPEARAVAVPPLLLQPLVENAVRHGIAVSSSASRIRVTGRVERPGGRLILEVEDDGPGIEAANGRRGTGTGLANTRARLQQIFGADQHFAIAQCNGSGTLVRIDLPARAPDVAQINA